MNETLRILGLSPTAEKIYLTLLKLGKGSADEIARSSNVYKANTYDALNKLIEHGLVTSTKDGKRLYAPTNPAKLPQIVEEFEKQEKEKIENLKKGVAELLPSLTKLYSNVYEKEVLEIYRGKKAFKRMMNEIIAEKPKEWKGFGNLQVFYYFPNESNNWFKKINVKLFSNKTKEVKERLEEAEKITSCIIKWLPDEVIMSVVWTLFGKNLLIIIYEPELIVVRIKAKEVVKSFSTQFDYLWK